MSTVYTVQEEYERLLNEYLTDPNTERRTKGKKWIFDDLPAATLGPAEYPRISVMHVSSPSQQHEVGQTTQRLNAKVEIQIRTLKNLKFNQETASKFINDLALDVVDIIRSGTAYVDLRTNAGVFQTTLDQENIAFPNDMVIKSLIYSNIMKR